MDNKTYRSVYWATNSPVKRSIYALPSVTFELLGTFQMANYQVENVIFGVIPFFLGVPTFTSILKGKASGDSYRDRHRPVPAAGLNVMSPLFSDAPTQQDNKGRSNNKTIQKSFHKEHEKT